MNGQSNAALPAIPGFDVLQRLGHGGMGVVYKAWQASQQRMVAIKLILNQGGPRANFLQLARFRIEADAVACVSHPNIVLIHQVGVHGGHPYIVLEYVAGGSLRQRIQQGPLDPRRAAQLAKTVAEALHHTHQRGILHRDLKPDNIMLADDETPKVTDFGLAKFLGSTEEAAENFSASASIMTRFDGLDIDPDYQRLYKEFAASKSGSPDSDVAFQEFATHTLCQEASQKSALISLRPSDVDTFVTEVKQQAHAPLPAGIPQVFDLTFDGAVLGSPRYMAPEQAAGDTGAVGPHTDVYSLGATLYEMLAGQPPFDASEFRQMMYAIAHEKPRPIQRNVADDLKLVCMTCLNKDPKDRYPSGAALAEDLGRFLEGFEIERGTATNGT